MDEMVNKKAWEEFRESGLLWFINTILHMFGWAICVEIEDGKITDAYPARVKFRGFNEEHNTEGYIKVSEFLSANAKVLEAESKE